MNIKRIQIQGVTYIFYSYFNFSTTCTDENIVVAWVYITEIVM